MSSTEFLEIRVLNWEKYQAEAKRYKSPGWFRLDIKIMDHALWDILTPTQFKLFICILCLVTKSGSGSGRVTTTLRQLRSQLGSNRGIKTTQTEAGLVSLRDLCVLEYQIVGVGSPTDFRRLRNDTERYDTEPNEILSDDEGKKPEIPKDQKMLLSQIGQKTDWYKPN